MLYAYTCTCTYTYTYSMNVIRIMKEKQAINLRVETWEGSERVAGRCKREKIEVNVVQFYFN